MASLERAYAMFLHCHRIVATAANEAELAREVCRAAVEDLGYVLAWVGLWDTASARVLPVAHAGFDDGYLENLIVVPDDPALGHGPTGTALRERRPAVCRDIAHDPAFAPWRADATARGYGSSAAIPLRRGAHAIGALNLYAREPDAFDEREIALLEEVAFDLTLGIVALRSPAWSRDHAAPLEEIVRMETACAVAASVAHDLQNMLGVVMLSVSDLAKRTPQGTSDPAYVDANDALRGAAELTRQMLQLSRRAAAKIESVDVDTCLLGTHPLLARIAGTASRVSLDLHADRARVALAPIDLQRIVINLVLNAAQAASYRAHVRLETRTETRTNEVVLRVVDDGPGIAPELLERVFDAQISTKGAGGSGLGLASVAKLVRGIGGRVRAEAAPDGGTVFVITMPVLHGSSRPPVAP